MEVFPSALLINKFIHGLTKGYEQPSAKIITFGMNSSIKQNDLNDPDSNRENCKDVRILNYSTIIFTPRHLKAHLF